MMANDGARDEEIRDALKAAGEKLESASLGRVLGNGKIEKQLKIFLAAAWVGQMPERRACLMDKQFNRVELDMLGFEIPSGNEVAGPVVWIETKCDFIQKADEARMTAGQARNQIAGARARMAYDVWPAARTLKEAIHALRDMQPGAGGQDMSAVKSNVTRRNASRLREHEARWAKSIEPQLGLPALPTYIVHFLNSIPLHVSPVLPEWIVEKFRLPRRTFATPPVAEDRGVRHDALREDTLKVLQDRYNLEDGAESCVWLQPVNVSDALEITAAVVRVVPRCPRPASV